MSEDRQPRLGEDIDGDSRREYDSTVRRRAAWSLSVNDNEKLLAKNIVAKRKTKRWLTCMVGRTSEREEQAAKS